MPQEAAIPGRLYRVRRICSWCDAELAPVFWPNDAGETHTICDPCARQADRRAFVREALGAGRVALAFVVLALASFGLLR